MNARTQRGRRLGQVVRAALSLGLTRRLVLLTAIALAATAFGASAASASAQEFSFGASAYGTQVRVGSTVTSGRSALAFLGCTSTAGITHTNTAASAGVPPCRRGRYRRHGPQPR